MPGVSVLGGRRVEGDELVTNMCNDCVAANIAIIVPVVVAIVFAIVLVALILILRRRGWGFSQQLSLIIYLLCLVFFLFLSKKLFSFLKSFLNLIILSIYIILFLCLFGFRVLWAPFEWLHLKGGLISWSWWMLNLYICVHTWRQQQQKQQLKNTKTILCNIHVAIEEDLLFHCTCRISCNS